MTHLTQRLENRFVNNVQADYVELEIVFKHWEHFILIGNTLLGLQIIIYYKLDHPK